MATIPIYDEATLPCISFPLDNTHQATKRYLGGKAVSGEVYADINLFIKNDTEADALHDFWVADCNYGLEPFLIPLPVFGRETDTSDPALLVKFVGDAKDTKNAGYWTAKRKLRILGTIIYIIDDGGNFILDDVGDFVLGGDGSYVATGNEINSYKEVVYGND